MYIDFKRKNNRRRYLPVVAIIGVAVLGEFIAVRTFVVGMSHPGSQTTTSNDGLKTAGCLGGGMLIGRSLLGKALFAEGCEHLATGHGVLGKQL